MALDNAQFIAELSVTDPPGTDPLSQGDDQIRTIKRATQQSFPLIAAAVNLTDVQMNLMAIKNEANFFTNNNTFTGGQSLIPAQTTQVARLIWADTTLLERWQLDKTAETAASPSDLRLQAFDAAGVLLGEAWTVNNLTQVVDFVQVPTVQGAPLWIAGELRMFAASASPGLNWFLADGTNGTVDLTDRAMLGSGISSPGTGLGANMVGTAAAGNTGSTQLTVSQMPAHAHDLWVSSDSTGGITDVSVGPTAGDSAVGGRRVDAARAFSNTRTSGQLIDDTGSGAGHNHTQQSVAVTETGSGRDIVRPFSRVVEMHQYVP